MQTSLPVALSGQLATEKRLDTIANNLANARTVGFRSEEVKFESFLSRTAPETVAFTSGGERYISTRAGELTQTGNSLDMAVKGDAFFAIQTPKGTVYTRDGRMQMKPTGELVTVNGEPFLDVGGAPLMIDPSGGPISIAHDGMITQKNVQIGAVGLFKMPWAPISNAPAPPASFPTRQPSRWWISRTRPSRRAMWKAPTSIPFLR